MRGGQNKEKWYTQRRTTVQMFGLPTSVPQWCSAAANGDVDCLSKRQTNYPPIVRTTPLEYLIYQTQTTQDRTCLDTAGLDPIQMCQFHMLQIVRWYLTDNPKMKASVDLMLLMREMKHLTKEGFEAEYAAWKERYSEFLNKRVTHKDGKSCYLHRKVRTLVHSIDFYMPYLFSFQRPECAGMPNTNNKIEETFTDLKKSLNNHTGMSLQNRKRFISGFFLQRLN